MKEMETIVQMLPYIVPFIAVGFTLLAVALIDLVKRKTCYGREQSHLGTYYIHSNHWPCYLSNSRPQGGFS